jgi:hypothetical protein
MSFPVDKGRFSADQGDEVVEQHRTKVTKVPGSRAAGLARPGQAFKLIESAQDRWRAVNAPG